MCYISEYFRIQTRSLECVWEGKNFAHRKTNEKFKKALFEVRQLRDRKLHHHHTYKKKKKSHVLIRFLVKIIVFGSQDFPANNSGPDSPRTQTTREVPSSPRTARANLSLGLQREDEGQGEAEAEPRRNDSNNRTASSGHRPRSLTFAFVFPQRKKSNKHLFASQNNILCWKPKHLKLFLLAQIFGKEDRGHPSGTERQTISFLTHTKRTVILSTCSHLKISINQKGEEELDHLPLPPEHLA